VQPPVKDDMFPNKKRLTGWWTCLLVRVVLMDIYGSRSIQKRTGCLPKCLSRNQQFAPMKLGLEDFIFLKEGRGACFRAFGVRRSGSFQSTSVTYWAV